MAKQKFDSGVSGQLTISCRHHGNLTLFVDEIQRFLGLWHMPWTDISYLGKFFCDTNTSTASTMAAAASHNAASPFPLLT